MPGTPPDLTLRTAKLAALSCSLVAALYAVLEATPSPLVQLFLLYSPLFTVILWLQKDARRTGVARVQDLGLFLWIAWPILLPWYAFTTRGWAGWRLLLGLVGLMFSSWLAALLSPWIWYGVRYAIWYVRYGS